MHGQLRHVGDLDSQTSDEPGRLGHRDRVDVVGVRLTGERLVGAVLVVDAQRRGPRVAAAAQCVRRARRLAAGVDYQLGVGVRRVDVISDTRWTRLCYNEFTNIALIY